jgi:hypothetical protein
MRLIWADAKAEYFCMEGLTRFLKIRSDLPVVLLCRRPAQDLHLPGKQISPQRRRAVGKAHLSRRSSKSEGASVPTNAEHGDKWLARHNCAFAYLANSFRSSLPLPPVSG